MTKLNEVSISNFNRLNLHEYENRVFVNETFAITLSGGALREHIIEEDKLYRMKEARLMMVISGNAHVQLNLENIDLCAGDIVMAPANTILELKNCSADYNFNGILFPTDIRVEDLIIINTSSDEWLLLNNLVEILWHIAHLQPFPTETIHHYIMTLTCLMGQLAKKHDIRAQNSRLSRHERMFQDFKRLVNENCISHRNIPYYAERLFVSPHHLSAVISKTSGKSVMYWINRAVILQAKVLLRQRDLQINEIAYRLKFPNHSAFGKFFKRETGFTPGEYRSRG